MTEQSPLPPSPGGSAAGCALFAIGMLFLIPSGLCTAFGLFGLITELVSDPARLTSDFTDLSGFVVLTLGALAIGVGLVWAGLRVRRG